MQTHTHYQSRAKEAGVHKLRQLMGAEMSAAETYELALQSVDHTGLHHALETILASHSHRVEQILAQIGGTEPVAYAGVWASFARAFQAGGDLLGNDAALAALQEGEDQLLRLYEEDFRDFDAQSYRLIQDRLVLSQRLTDDLCRMLESHLQPPS